MKVFDKEDMVKIIKPDSVKPGWTDMYDAVVGKIGTIIRYDSDDCSYRVAVDGKELWFYEEELEAAEEVRIADLLDISEIL